MINSLKQIQKTRILGSNIFQAILKVLSEKEKEKIIKFGPEELKEIIKFIYHKLSTQIDNFIN